MNPPTISICIPVYNVEDYLPQCLDSIINQTFTNFEVIIVNDASPDNSEAIIKSYQKKDSRIRYYKHEKNIGPNDTRKTAIDHARGDYLSFVDSDDWVESTFLAKLYEKATSTQADVTVCNYFTQTPKGSFKKALFFNIDNSTTLFKWHLKTHGLAPAFWNKLWKRNLFSKPDLTFPNMFFAEDMLITTKLLFYAQKISIIDEPLYHYSTYHRPLPTNNSIIKTKAIRHVEDEVTLHEELISFFSKHNLKQEITHSLFQRHINLTVLARQSIIAKDKEMQKLVTELLKTYFSEPPYVINSTKLFLKARLGLWVKTIFPISIVNAIRGVYYRLNDITS